MQCSPIKYQEGHPQVVFMAMLKDSFSQSPHMKVQCLTASEEKLLLDFRLPLFLNKFSEPVDMPLDNFNKYWADITHNKPHSFQKIDVILKNPAPPNVPIQEVLKKIINFFQSSMNLKVFQPENLNDFTNVKAVGEMNFKPENQNGFPTNPQEVQKPISVPIMMEAQFFEEDTSEFKLSFRSSDAKLIASPLINFLKFFVQPQ
mmetsp:Transcript_20300/g.19225  ORF Transcript_20300/g.19225 Transcript_20300/m.19225 type:complete len:203 (+) Transcript_20300:1729-2337(+)